MIFLNDDVIKPEPDKGFVKIKRVWKQSILYFFLSKRIFAIRFTTYKIKSQGIPVTFHKECPAPGKSALHRKENRHR